MSFTLPSQSKSAGSAFSTSRAASSLQWSMAHAMQVQPPYSINAHLTIASVIFHDYLQDCTASHAQLERYTYHTSLLVSSTHLQLALGGTNDQASDKKRHKSSEHRQANDAWIRRHLCGANAESKLHRYVMTGVVENINAPEKDSRRRTLLHVACSGPTEMCLSCVKLLLQKGARTNVVTGEGHGRTPLMMADSPQVVDCLIDFDADLTQQDAYGHTALAVAATDGKLPLVKALLQRGAAPQILIASDRGYTPLTAAVRQRHEGIAVLLLRAAVKLPDYDIDAAVWPWKQSVLHEAAEEGYEDLVTAALDCGASVNAKNGAGVTALQTASSTKQWLDLLNDPSATSSGLETYSSSTGAAVAGRVVAHSSAHNTSSLRMASCSVCGCCEQQGNHVHCCTAAVPHQCT
eukprot:19735-Heterococcus_DN1.PRE.1